MERPWLGKIKGEVGAKSIWKHLTTFQKEAKTSFRSSETDTKTFEGIEGRTSTGPLRTKTSHELLHLLHQQFPSVRQIPQLLKCSRSRASRSALPCCPRLRRTIIIASTVSPRKLGQVHYGSTLRCCTRSCETNFTNSTVSSTVRCCTRSCGAKRTASIVSLVYDVLQRDEQLFVWQRGATESIVRQTLGPESSDRLGFSQTFLRTCSFR